jgi:hypothetical protein
MFFQRQPQGEDHRGLLQLFPWRHILLSGVLGENSWEGSNMLYTLSQNPYIQT